MQHDLRRWIQLSERLNEARSYRRVQTNSKAFRQWFGDSKVVDEHGQPLVVYHGTREDFDVFDAAKTGSATDFGWFGSGIYLTPKPSVASNYAQMVKAGDPQPLGHVMPLYVRATDPFITDHQSMSDAYVREVLADGHDAIFRVDYPDDTIPQEIVVFDSRQIKSAIGNRGTFNANDPRIQESSERTTGKVIRAFHGSPHEFAEFDVVKIGTGEGAQSYGYGMYFAESEAVARSYREALSPRIEWKVPPEKIKPEFVELGFSQAAVDMARRELEHFHGEASEVVGVLDGLSLYGGNRVAREAAALIRAFNKDVVRGGWMYEVEIRVDPANLLEWERLLHDQSRFVQTRIKRILSGQPGGNDEIWVQPGTDEEINLTPMEPSERAVTERTLGKLGYGRIAPRWEHVLERSSPRQLALGDDPVQSSKMLHGAGIPGIRYLDGQSRGRGRGTYNYVMFDVSRVKIIRKYK